MRERFLARLDTMLRRVDLAIDNHRQGISDDLSIPLLMNVRRELIQMRPMLSPEAFTPGYGRFVLDWPDDHGLVGELLEVAYEYKRLQGSA